jgi:hypothetical protein
MSSSRIASLGLICLFASACTVVVQPPAEQPQPAPSASEPDDREPGPRVSEPKRRPPSPREAEPDRRAPTPRTGEPRRVDPPPHLPEADPEPRNEPGRSSAARLGIPPGHLPPLGRCRVWIEGSPPGRQARARACNGILATAPVGSWVLYRPTQYQRQLRVRYLHATQRRVVAVRAYDAETGAYLRDLSIAEDDDNMGPRVTSSSGATVRPTGNPRGTTRGNDRSRGDENRSTNAGDKSRGQNRGNSAGQTDTTSSTGSAGVGRGNQGNENRPGNAGDKSRGQNRGNSAGQTDTTSSTGSAGVGRGNQGNENRPGNAGDKSRDQNRGNSAGQADTTSSSGSTGVGRGNQGNENRPGNSGDKSRGQNRGNSAGQTETTNAAGGAAQPNRGNRGDRGQTGAAGDGSQSQVRDTGVTPTGATSNPPSPRGTDLTSVAVTDGSGVDEESDGSAHRTSSAAIAPGGQEQPELGIDPQHYPREGRCRVWLPGQPAERQARATNCNRIETRAPAGSWILRRASDQPDVILVDYIDDQRAGVVVRTSAYVATTGDLILQR